MAPLAASAGSTAAVVPPPAAPAGPPAAPAPPAVSAAAGGTIETPAGASAEPDVLRADAETRRKVEMDLARLGMKPEEIRRLIDANANTTAPPPGHEGPLPGPASLPVMPQAPAGAKKANARLKVAARAADLQTFAAQLQSSTAAGRVQAVEAVTLDLPDFRPSTPQETQQADAMLREVFALRRREKYVEALAKCREALDLVPSDAAALEMFGDLLQGLARTNEAMAAYKRATEADPKRASAERKYGDLLMRQQQWVEPDTEQVPRNPIAAAVFSLLIPGAGQIHNGERLKGAVLVVLATICAAMVIYLRWDKQGYEPSSQKPAVRATVPMKREKPPPIDWGAEAPMLCCLAFYGMLSIGSAIDAAAVAQRNRLLQ
jgi:tetratricopeptide (TPR) repeat protein